MTGQRALVLAVGDQRWSLQGGWREDGVLGLRIAVVNGDDIERYSVRLVIDADEALTVGEPVVSEGWPE